VNSLDQKVDEVESPYLKREMAAKVLIEKHVKLKMKGINFDWPSPLPSRIQTPEPKEVDFIIPEVEIHQTLNTDEIFKNEENLTKDPSNISKPLTKI
jgi:hypothetical protein